MIARQFTVLNLVLAALLVTGLLWVLPAWLSPPETTIPQAALPPSVGNAVSGPAAAEDLAYPPYGEFANVSEKNLFHPDRTIPQAPPPTAPPPEKPAFVLYGIIEAGPDSVALLEDKKNPAQTKGRGRRIQSIRLGQEIGGYRLASVAPDAVVMTFGEERLTIPLIDAQNPKNRSPAPKTVRARPPRKPTTKDKFKRTLADAFKAPRGKRTKR